MIVKVYDPKDLKSFFKLIPPQFLQYRPVTKELYAVTPCGIIQMRPGDGIIVHNNTATVIENELAVYLEENASKKSEIDSTNTEGQNPVINEGDSKPVEPKEAGRVRSKPDKGANAAG